jgi:repressor of nif and glnA expression
MDAGLGMGRFWTLARAGAEVAGFRVPPAEVALGTVCAITFNGVLRAAGVPVVSRFGGLLELHDGRPARFTHLIRYDGTTLDPLEIFIKARMTSVRAAAETGNGVIGASFREVPAVALPLVEKTVEQFRRAGLGGLIAIGDPSRPLLDIPVSQDRAGVAIAAGLNPMAAVHESGIPTANHAMARLWRFEALEAINGEAAG